VTARAAQDACTALRFRRTWGWEFGVGGQVVRSGARVQVMLGSANHDPDQFDSPAPMKASFSRKPRPRAIDRGAETSPLLGFARTQQWRTAGWSITPVDRDRCNSVAGA
jgi:cytochrome P450